MRMSPELAFQEVEMDEAKGTQDKKEGNMSGRAGGGTSELHTEQIFGMA